jgi:hypothetical protein
MRKTHSHTQIDVLIGEEVGAARFLLHLRPTDTSTILFLVGIWLVGWLVGSTGFSPSGLPALNDT